jgi:hypothetical protein
MALFTTYYGARSLLAGFTAACLSSVSCGAVSSRDSLHMKWCLLQARVCVCVRAVRSSAYAVYVYEMA